MKFSIIILIPKPNNLPNYLISYRLISLFTFFFSKECDFNTYLLNYKWKNMLPVNRFGFREHNLQTIRYIV